MKLPFALTALFATAATALASPLATERLRVEYLDSPLGIDIQSPRLSWELASPSGEKNKKQTAYEIRVATALAGKDADFASPVWGSGKITGSDTNQIPLAIKALNPFTSYHWQIRVWDEAGEVSAWSPAAVFTTGPLTSEDWAPAKWIGEPADSPAAKKGRSYYDNLPPCPYLRKEIKVTKPVAKAYVHTSALGFYDLRINGKKVGTRLLAPERTVYDKHTLFQTDDVTALLQAGTNALAVELSDGWYAGGIWSHPGRGFYGTHRKFLAQLRVTYTDGSTEVFATDGSWKFLQEGPRSKVSIYGGETFTAAKIKTGWELVGYDDSAWKTATVWENDKASKVLVAQMNEPVAVIQEIRPVRVYKAPNKEGAYIFDLGQNIVGWCRLTLPYNPGRQITLRHFEITNEDGSYYRANLRASHPDDHYVPADEKTISYEPRFTFHGFRYVQVEGLSKAPDAANLIGVVITSAMPIAGAFESSNKDINKLWQNIRWSQWDNQVSIPTDCPQRDEREGWMADAQVFAQNAIYNLDMAAFYTKWCRDIRDDQHPDGRFPDIAPRNGNNGFVGAPGWADAGVVVPWRVYENYGDARLLGDSLDSIKRFVDLVHRNNPDLLWRKGRGHDFGDWLHGSTFRRPPDAYPRKGAEIPKEAFATGYFYYSAYLTAQTAKVLGKTADYEKYSKLADGIKAAFNKQYVAPDGKIAGDNQGAYAMVLALRLIPDELRANAAKRLVKELEFYDWRLSTGFHSTIWMMKELAANGYADVAYRLLLSRRFPSWFYSIDNGATTIWERWDGYVKGRGFQSAGMNSFNHYSLGAVGEWMYENILGIQLDPKSPGWRHFIVKPLPGGDLTWAKGSYHAITGKISVSWRIDSAEKTYTLELTVPANTTATVTIPYENKTLEVGSGQHKWVVKI
ncbi:MAG: glycoside hydrolase family 78 protein [Puniceicoccales bacterium]|jgi:alpha-L-rhamnosidase|nr:glycoside hydrolase family 78 protein [Puniceicoccales bacterium]